MQKYKVTLTDPKGKILGSKAVELEDNMAVGSTFDLIVGVHQIITDTETGPKQSPVKKYKTVKVKNAIAGVNSNPPQLVVMAISDPFYYENGEKVVI